MDEKILVEKLKNPSEKKAAFGIFVREYQKRLYHLIKRMVINHEDTDDVLQEVFIKIWNNIDQYKGDAALFTWAYRIASNEALQFLRKKKRTMMFQNNIDHEMATAIQQNPELSGDAIQAKLQKAIAGLPEKQRLVFNLKYYEELKYEEIAAITDSSVGSLKASYHHAVKKIEEYVTSH